MGPPSCLCNLSTRGGITESMVCSKRFSQDGCKEGEHGTNLINYMGRIIIRLTQDTSAQESEDWHDTVDDEFRKNCG